MSARSRTPLGADGLTRRTLLVAAAPLLVRRRPGPPAYGAEVPAAWFDLALDLVRTTPGYSPPVAARTFAYAGIALREAVTPRGVAHHCTSVPLYGLARTCLIQPGAHEPERL